MAIGTSVDECSSTDSVMVMARRSNSCGPVGLLECGTSNAEMTEARPFGPNQAAVSRSRRAKGGRPLA